MTYIPNSIEARDVASLVHMQTNLRLHQKAGPLVIARGEGCRVSRLGKVRLSSTP